MSLWLEIRRAFAEFAPSFIAAAKNLQWVSAFLLLSFITSLEVESLLHGHVLPYSACWTASVLVEEG